MKYIKSDEYTYDEMWEDTQDILDKYYWELDDIETYDNMGIAKFHSTRYGVHAEYTIEYKNYYSDCYITDVDYKTWLDDMINVVGQLRHIWHDINDAME